MKKETLYTVAAVTLVLFAAFYMAKKNMEPATDAHKNIEGI